MHFFIKMKTLKQFITESSEETKELIIIQYLEDYYREIRGNIKDIQFYNQDCTVRDYAISSYDSIRTILKTMDLWDPELEKHYVSALEGKLDESELNKIKLE